MKLSHWTAALVLATLAVAPVANAADARLADCNKIDKVVAAALETAQPGDTTDQARRERVAGHNYCGLSLYTVGVAHYTKALQLLGKA